MRWPWVTVKFCRHACFSLLLPPATKLGQGNIFRSVCQEFCSHPGAVRAGRYGQVVRAVRVVRILLECILVTCISLHLQIISELRKSKKHS